MSNTIISPNMNLPVPIVGVEPGPDWANDINSCLSAIDSHNHTSGQGLPITPAAMQIDADLSFSYASVYYNATNLRTVRFNNNAVAPALVTDRGCLYELNNDLYYNDGAGNQVRITSGGSIVGTAGSISGLPSGTAGVAYTSLNGTYTFSQATSTAANLDAATYVLRYPGSYPTPSGNYIALRAPSTLASGFAYTFPNATPAANNNYLTCSTTGTLSYSNSNDVAQLVTRSTGTTVGVLGVAKSTACPSSNTTSTTAVDVTNLSVTITTSGRPVFIGLTADPSSSGRVGVYANASTGYVGGYCQIVRGASIISKNYISLGGSGTSNAWALYVPVSSVNMVDFPTAGTYTYKIQIYSAASTMNAFIEPCFLIAYEL